MSPPDTAMVIDRAHYDMIVENRRDVQHICRTLDALVGKVDALSDQFGDCPCEAVKAAQKDIGDLKTSTAYTTGKVTGIATALTLAANYVAPYIFGRP